MEGGGDESGLKTECHRGFGELLGKAGFKGKMPSVKALGGRKMAFDAFEFALSQSDNREFALLLVDSEEIPASNDVWAHLKKRDRWDKPAGMSDDQAHLMIACMETWLAADPDAMAKYFGQGFKRAKLPTTALEKRHKLDIQKSIDEATGTARPKGRYDKARDSFKLLGLIDPEKLQKGCVSAKRFFDALREHC
jgi:hypothetical protein